MPLVGLPAQTCAVISQMATTKARQDVMGRGWRSAGALQPVSNQGEVGIRSTMKHLLYQNSGVKSFLMYWVEGRTVPITDKTGTHFVRGREVGKPGYVNIPGRGRVWRNQKWRYPGLQPKRFIESSIAQAVKENRELIRSSVIRSVTEDRSNIPWLT
ncbi:hypothetical protein MYRNA_120 [Mycobacterium phage Myrna]|uniref:Uncharacterized protein n=1 Tax=Mycobacterium phage Myrna TaxID=546805 RepID=B5LJC4_9CAUD|nr:119 [Mycobacterium phage Myrna]ACH62121.1 hypothetical protein MYRNA_120 [Mycobacterium phage Myrna]